MINENLVITYTCNQKCIFCLMDKKEKNVKKFSESKVKGDLNKEILKNEIKEISKRSKGITFIGGEPTIREDLPELISYANNFDFKTIEINTNGVNLSNKEYLNDLIKKGLNSIVFSLHTHEKEMHQFFTQTENFEKTLKGFENSINSGVNVRVVHIINKQNYKKLEDFIDFLLKFNPDRKKFTISFTMIRTNVDIFSSEDKKEIKKLMPDINESLPFIEKMFKKCEKNNIDFVIDGIPICFMKENIENNLNLYDQKDRPIVFNDQQKTHYNVLFLNLKSKCLECQFCSRNNECVGFYSEYLSFFNEPKVFPFK